MPLRRIKRIYETHAAGGGNSLTMLMMFDGCAM
jgi:hypothetical protein